MSQIILDSQLNIPKVWHPIRKWITAERLQKLRPGELILDERVPAILLSLKQPTFITIDQGFWDVRWCHANYAILFFALRDDQQELLPGLLRALLRRPEFRTRSRRMGKVAKISQATVEYWQFPSSELHCFAWKRPAGGKGQR